jgi:thiamine kinase-like enzyme
MDAAVVSTPTPPTPTVPWSVASALEFVKTHLGGVWLELAIDGVEFAELKGGASSKIYKLEDKSGKLTGCDSKLFIRVYAGGKLYDPENDTIGRLSEAAQAVLAFKLGELGHGPRQLAFFQGGRIEEFVPNRNLNASDLDNLELVEQLARKVAIYHGMDKVVPTTRKPRDAIAIIQRHIPNWSQEWLQHTLEETLSVDQKSGLDFELLRKFDFQTELKWIGEIQKLAESPLVHAHYDVNSGNTLIRDTPDQHGHRVMLVDYEGACIAPRGFDLATHFNFHLFDATKPTYLSQRSYPGLEYRRFFIGKCLEEWQKVNRELNPQTDTVDHILWETDILGLLHAVFLLSWWLVPGNHVVQDPTLLRTFMGMGQTLLKSYFERKTQLLDRI